MGLKGSILTNPSLTVEHKDKDSGETLVKISLEGTDPLNEGFIEQPKWISYTRDEKQDVEFITRELQKNFIEHLARLLSYTIKKVEGLEDYEVDGQKFKLEFLDDTKQEVTRKSLTALLRICEVEGINLADASLNFYNNKKKFKKEDITVVDKKKDE